MTYMPRLSFTKYVSRMGPTFLTDYLERLPDLHPTYQGLLLPGSTQPGSGSEAVAELLSLLDKSVTPRKGFICSHRVKAEAKCGGFSWDMTFERFGIYGGAFDGVIGYPLALEDDFVSAYESEKAFLASQAPQWIEGGLCNKVTDFGDALLQVSDAWDVYLSAKDLHKYEPRSIYINSLLDFWGEYAPEGRTLAGDLLDTLRPLVNSYYPDTFTGSCLRNETEKDHLAFVRYADERLIRYLGRDQFSALLSPVDISLDQWLVAGEPEPANYSIGGILLPG